MPPVSIRRLIGMIGLVVALATAIAIPAGYALTAYFAEAETLAFKARLNADRVARYIYVHGDLWRFHRARLAELIALPDARKQDLVRQRVYAAPDRLVLDDETALTWPTFARAAPIMVNGAEVGRMEAEASLRPLLARTALIAIFAIALGGVSFLLLYRFPLRMLGRTMAELERRDGELQAQNYRFETALENMSQGLCMFDAQQRVVVCNRRYASMYGLPPEYAKPGTELRRIIEHRQAQGQWPAQLSRETTEHLLAALPRPAISWYETVDLPDGRVISLSCRHMEGGGWIALHEDITERRRAEEERLRIEAEAEHARQQEHAAEMANRAKTSFLAMMSHEIRTPMNGVLGLTSSLLESDLDAEQRQTLLAIHESGESLLRILNDILDYSKLDAGKLEFEQLAFSPVMLVDHLISIIAPRANAKGLAVRAENDAALPPALIGDAGRLRQVLLNLLANAVKFTPTGEIAVTTRCLSREADHIKVEWAVSDTGIGIAADRIDTLFSDYVQGDSSISRRYGGSGLGLAISKRIVSQMGGTITATSTLGQGSTFRVVMSLPWADSISLDDHDDRNSVATLKARIADLGRSLRVLIAEDNPTNQLVATKMLKTFDVAAHVAADGLEAVAAVGRFQFDVIFMDMRMPEMDGLEATRIIRARGGACAEVPIIALTANAFAPDIKACREAGMTDFVAKPIRRHTLVEAILRALPSAPVAVPGPGGIDAPPIAAAQTPPAPERRSPNPRAPSGQPMVDLDAIDSLSAEIGLDGVRETLAVFLDETTDRLVRLRKLSCVTDRDTIQIEAHTLKGASGSMGLRQLSALAQALEKGAGALTEQSYRDALDGLDVAFAEARERIPIEFLEAA